MLKRFYCGYFSRNFSKSSVWKNLEKSKQPEPPSGQSHQTKASSTIMDTSITIAPSEWDKRVLLFSGKYKSKKEIPSRIRYEEMNNAKSKVRIRMANLMMGATVVACLSVIYVGKKRQKAGDSLLKRMTSRDDELREEGRIRREGK